MTNPIATPGSRRQFIFIALLFAVGVEMLRLFMSSLMYYLREAQEASTTTVGGVAFLCFLGAFLAPPLARVVGVGRLIRLCALGLMATRIAIQFVETPVADFGLAIAGAVLFLWAIPLSASLASDGRRVDGGTWLLGMLTGLGLDTAIKGGLGTVDLSWQTNAASDALAVIMALALSTFAKTATWGVREDKGEAPGLSGSLLLFAVGPFLFLQMLYFQNLGQQASLIGWELPATLALVTGVNLVGVVAASLALGPARRLSWLEVPVAGAVLVVVMWTEHTGAIAAVIMAAGHILLVSLMAALAAQSNPDSGLRGSPWPGYSRAWGWCCSWPRRSSTTPPTTSISAFRRGPP